MNLSQYISIVKQATTKRNVFGLQLLHQLILSIPVGFFDFFPSLYFPTFIGKLPQLKQLFFKTIDKPVKGRFFFLELSNFVT